MRNIVFNVKIWGKVIEREDNLNLAQFSDKLFKIIIYSYPVFLQMDLHLSSLPELFLVYIYSEIYFLVHN